jgi:hypothetical protein
LKMKCTQYGLYGQLVFKNVRAFSPQSWVRQTTTLNHDHKILFFLLLWVAQG